MVDVKFECSSYLSLIRLLQSYLSEDEVSKIIDDLISGKKKDIVVSF